MIVIVIRIWLAAMRCGKNNINLSETDCWTGDAGRPVPLHEFMLFYTVTNKFCLLKQVT